MQVPKAVLLKAAESETGTTAICYTVLCFTLKMLLLLLLSGDTTQLKQPYAACGSKLQF